MRLSRWFRRLKPLNKGGGGHPVSPPPPPPPPPPPTVPVAPLSVSAPVQGTDLTAVWNLQAAGATGPTVTPTKTVTNNWADLQTIGAQLDNYSAVWFDVPAGQTWTVDGYDFTAYLTHTANEYGIRITGDGTINFSNCNFGFQQSVAFPSDINENIGAAATPTIIVTHCDFNDSSVFTGGGYLTFNYCRFRNQRDWYGATGQGASSTYYTKFYMCYMTGGGCAPSPNQHVECWQYLASGTAQGTFIVDSCLQLLTDGQVNVAPWGSGWTGVWSVGPCNGTYINCIVGGIQAVNASPTNPNRIGCWLAYGTPGYTQTITNCVLDPGCFGYTVNEGGTGVRPVDGGGNRDYTNNTAITAANFG